MEPDEGELLAGYTGEYIPSTPRYAPEPECRPVPRHSSQKDDQGEIKDEFFESEPQVDYADRGFAQFVNRDDEPDEYANQTTLFTDYNSEYLADLSKPNEEDDNEQPAFTDYGTGSAENEQQPYERPAFTDYGAKSAENELNEEVSDEQPAFAELINEPAQPSKPLNSFSKYGAGYSADLDDVPAPNEDIAVIRQSSNAPLAEGTQQDQQREDFNTRFSAVGAYSLNDTDEEDDGEDDIDTDDTDDLDDTDDTDDVDADENDIDSAFSQAIKRDLEPDGGLSAMFAALPRTKKPLSERLKEMSDKNKLLYTALKNELLSYKNLKARMGNKVESFNIKRIQIAKVALSGKTIRVYLALKPDEFDESVYKHKDVSDKRRFEFTPMMLRLKNEKNLEKIIELIHDIMLQSSFEKRKAFEQTDYVKQLRDINATPLGRAGRSDLILDSTDAAASAAVPDEVAEDCVEIQECQPIGKVKSQIVTIGQINNAFVSGQTVDLKQLKRLKMINRDTNYVEILGEGSLNKTLTVVANAYDFNAVKSILILGGTPIYLKEKAN